MLQRTLPGERFERRQVEVSVVQQLKQRRLTRSESFVDASSVYMMDAGVPLLGGIWVGAGG